MGPPSTVPTVRSQFAEHRITGVAGCAPSGRQPVMARAARNYRPDIHNHVILDDMEHVITIHCAGRVARNERYGVTELERRAGWRGENAVLLVEPEDRKIMTNHRHVAG